VLDVYIDEHFNHPLAGLRIIRSLNRLLAEPNADTASSLRSALKVWSYLIKCASRSLELQREEIRRNGGTHDEVDAEYHEALSAHLAAINSMMAATTPASIIGTHTIALQHFTSILPELVKVFPAGDLVDVAMAFIQANKSVKGKILVWKLIALLRLAKSFLFEDVTSRARLVEEVVAWIKPHFGRFDEYAQAQEGESAIDSARIAWLESSRLCITILAVMLDKLQECLVNPRIASDPKALRKEMDNVELIVPLLPRLLAAYLEFESPASHHAIARSRALPLVATAMPVSFPESYPFSLIARLPASSPESKRDSVSSRDGPIFNIGLGETAIVILVLVMSAAKADVHGFLMAQLEIEGRENMAHLLSQLFVVAASVLENRAFPGNWLNVNVLAHVALIRLMEPVADLMERHFIPTAEVDGHFDVGLWRAAISILLRLLSSEQLVIEDLSPQV
jgi:dedicator of cytokinesis protein 3